MEDGGNGNMFIREQSGNNFNNSNNLAWENIWALNNHHSRFDLGKNTADETTNTTHSEGNATHALLFPHGHQYSLYAGGGDGTNNLHPDPHLTCLKLGKRHYFEDATAARQMGGRHVVEGGFSMVKRGSFSGGGGGVGPSSSSPVPRCQVEGCHVALINAKDYHKRHKVCEMHSKAPKVMVLGLEQRFCQQCSRFHVVSEFDDSKRSCRRRLAGHNERRRKSSHDSLSRNSSQVNKLMSGRFPSATGRALSLLSSSNADSCRVSSSDLSSRCSAALRELIAENRAAILARHLILDGHDWHLQTAAGSDSMTRSHKHQIMLTEHHNWGRYQDTNNTHVTLDLMQAPSEELGFLSMSGKAKEEGEECSELWCSLEGDHVV